MLLGEGHAPGGHAGLLLHLDFAGLVAAPHGLDEAAVLLLKLLGLLQGIGGVDVLLQVLLGLVVHLLLHQFKLLGGLGLHVLELDGDLLAVGAAHQDALAVLQISRAALHPQGHALHLILGALPAHGVVGLVGLHPEAGLLEPLLQRRRALEDAGLVLGDGQDDDLDGSDLGREHQAVVVAVGHDNRADHPGGAAPGGLVGVLELVVPAGEGDAVGAAELIAKVVGGGALERLSVLHHALDSIRCLGAGKLLLVGLAAGHHGDGQNVFKEVGIAAKLLHGLVLGFLGGLVDGVSLLPPELAAPQEGTGGLLPADDAAPLVIEHGKLPVGLEGIGPEVGEHGLGGGAEGQALFQLLVAAMGDPGHLGREALDQLALLLEEALGNQHRHGHILMSRLLEHAVHDLLHVLPDGVAIGTEDGKALDAGVLHQFRLAADVGIPLGKVHLHVGDLFNLFLFCHSMVSFLSVPSGPKLAV